MKKIFLILENLSGKIDIGVTFAVTPERQRVIDMTTPTIFVSRIFLIKIPPLKTNWQIFIKPFKPIIWILLCFFMLIVFTIILIIEIKLNGYSKISKMLNCFLLFKISLDQYVKFPKRGFSFHMIFCIWINFSLLIGTAYKSKLFYCKIIFSRYIYIFSRIIYYYII